MQLLPLSIVFAAVYIQLAVAAALTKGHITATLQNGTSYRFSTKYDFDYANIQSSITDPLKDPLLVQIDLKLAAEKGDATIETLNSEWSDVYPLVGYGIQERVWLNQGPGVDNVAWLINVPQTTPGAPASQGEDAFTALFAPAMAEYPFHASAIWKYNPKNGQLSPSYVAQNGTRIEMFSFAQEDRNEEGNMQFLISGNAKFSRDNAIPAVLAFVPLQSGA